MLKFSDYKYERIDIDDLKNNLERLIDEFKVAVDIEEQNRIIIEINHLKDYFHTMAELVSIRHSIDTQDEYYEKQNSYMDEITPVYEEVMANYAYALVNSKFRKGLEEKWGSHIFTLAETMMKTVNLEIIDDLQEENKLSSQYKKLKASAKIKFKGEVKNLVEMEPFLQSLDRETRKKAYEAETKFYQEHEDEFDSIYDELVKVRDRIAKKLGYKNFVEVGYARMLRTDYTPKDISVFREQVINEIVPVTTEIRIGQKNRLGLSELFYYDEKLEFLDGNAQPKGDSTWIIEKAKQMYSELSMKTKDFFEFMIDRELMDLEAKKGKATGGYCTYICDYKSPFIFANFSGTSNDVNVLTHEAGHAFQVYLSRYYELLEYRYSTFEACEIHSMSMEFFTWPWMKLFFEECIDKYKYSHLSNALMFIPYGVLVDEFQHYVYENPNVTPDDRKAKWRELEKKYLPHRDYTDNDFLNRGGYWFRQLHIFEMPFYYVDYALAQISAFELWNISNEDKEKAWKQYLKLCKAGGSCSYLNLLKLSDLSSPFDDGTLTKIIRPVTNRIRNIDDKLL